MLTTCIRCAQREPCLQIPKTIHASLICETARLQHKAPSPMNKTFLFVNHLEIHNIGVSDSLAIISLMFTLPSEVTNLSLAIDVKTSPVNLW